MDAAAHVVVDALLDVLELVPVVVAPIAPVAVPEIVLAGVLAIVLAGVLAGAALDAVGRARVVVRHYAPPLVPGLVVHNATEQRLPQVPAIQ